MLNGLFNLFWFDPGERLAFVITVGGLRDRRCGRRFGLWYLGLGLACGLLLQFFA